ncbi:hypothetical protein O3M35_005245 [Rhynocoris fuscipes]
MMSVNLEAVTKLSPLVIRILGFNPGIMTLQGTNTYLIGNGSRRILLDTGENNKPEYIEALKKVVDEEKAKLAHVIISHWHLDHIGGLKDVMDNFANETTVWKFRRSDAKNKNQFDCVPIKYLTDDQEIQVEGATVRVVHTPGHTTDHIVLHLKEENSVFSGDCILGTGTSVFEDLYDYTKSLEKILNLDAVILYPGHGPVVEDVRRKVISYIRHRQTREDQIKDVLNKFKGQNVTTLDIVKALYVDAPESLYSAAERNVINHLKKLQKEGLVIEVAKKEWTLK